MRLRDLLPLGLSVSFLLGCGSSPSDEPQRAAVSGHVTLDGKPLRRGVVRFIPADEGGGPQTTLTITDGDYTADASQGPVVGRHRIEIVSTDDGGYAPDNEEALEELQRSKNPPTIRRVSVPAIYNSHSTLTATVPPEGRENLHFELVSEQPR